MRYCYFRVGFVHNLYQIAFASQLKLTHINNLCVCLTSDPLPSLCFTGRRCRHNANSHRDKVRPAQLRVHTVRLMLQPEQEMVPVPQRMFSNSLPLRYCPTSALNRRISSRSFAFAAPPRCQRTWIISIKANPSQKSRQAAAPAAATKTRTKGTTKRNEEDPPGQQQAQLQARQERSQRRQFQRVIKLKLPRLLLRLHRRCPCWRVQCVSVPRW